MTATFLIELDVEDDTDLPNIALDVQDVLDDHLDQRVLSVKPWKRETTAMPSVPLPPPL
jgi:hypothetical protein